MKTVLSHMSLMLLLLCPLCVVGKCISDKVQSSVRVVSSHILQPGSSDRFLNEVEVKHKVSIIAAEDDALPYLQPIQKHQSAISHPQSHRSKRMDRGHTKATAVQPQPIRINTWTPRESPLLLDWERERVEAAVGEAISTVSNLLSVSRLPDRLLLNRDINKYCRFIWKNSSSANYNRCGRASEKYRTESCLGVMIPDDHLSGFVVYPHPDQPGLRVLKPDGLGVPDTDFLLYMLTQSTDKCRADSSVLAYSAHCQMDAEGRPVAGVMIVCRERLGMLGFSHERVVQTVIHELFHMLGFSRELFSVWRDCLLTSQNQVGVGCGTRGHATNTDDTGQMRLYSPSVMKALQTHLNSTNTDLGAPLENQDAVVGGLSSHWESRVLQGSIMTAALADPSLVRIDSVTLSALKDTGWYSVNLSRAQSLVWGEGEGALFGSLLTCNVSSFFCTGSGLGCHYLHLHKGVCQSDEYLEGCHVYKPLANGSECWKEENQEGSGVEEWRGEIYDSDSRCFLSSLVKKDHSSLRVPVAGCCYRHRCTGRNMYQIQVEGSDWLDCPAGESIEVAGFWGVVHCPDKRLCYYHDVITPVSTHRLLSAQLPAVSTSSERNHTQSTSSTTLSFNSVLHFSPYRMMKIMVSVLGTVAVLFLLAILIIIYRKCSASVRVHALIDVPHVPQLQTA